MEPRASKWACWACEALARWTGSARVGQMEPGPVKPSRDEARLLARETQPMERGTAHDWTRGDGSARGALRGAIFLPPARYLGQVKPGLCSPRTRRGSPARPVESACIEQVKPGPWSTRAPRPTCWARILRG